MLKVLFAYSKPVRTTTIVLVHKDLLPREMADYFQQANKFKPEVRTTRPYNKQLVRIQQDEGNNQNSVISVSTVRPGGRDLLYPNSNDGNLL